MLQMGTADLAVPNEAAVDVRLDVDPQLLAAEPTRDQELVWLILHHVTASGSEHNSHGFTTRTPAGFSDLLCAKIHGMRGIVRRSLLMLALAYFFSGCSDASRSPIEADPAVKSLAVEEVSAFIWSGDYRVHYVRVRLRETSGSPVTVSRIDLRFLGDGVDVTRSFSNISKSAIPGSATIELDDLKVVDEPHQLDAAQNIVATVIYSTGTGETGATVGRGSVPTCTIRFRIGGPTLIAVGESKQMSGAWDACPTGTYPLDGSQIRWRSLDPAIASVNGMGDVTGLANGLATIQGAYADVVNSHKVTIGL